MNKMTHRALKTIPYKPKKLQKSAFRKHLAGISSDLMTRKQVRKAANLPPSSNYRATELNASEVRMLNKGKPRACSIRLKPHYVFRSRRVIRKSQIMTRALLAN